MQLNALPGSAMPRGPLARWTLALGCVLLLALGLGARRARAQHSLDATGTVFYEKGGPLKMTVINPSVKANAQLVEQLSLNAGWQADVVSGASVAVVDAPGGSTVDAVTSATTLDDFRQVVNGGLGLRSEVARFNANYSYGWESDYKSQGFAFSAATDLFDRNTTLELGYGRGWDEVCDLYQPEAEQAIDRQRMPTSDGCFKKDEGRMERPLDLHTVHGSWTQAWTPIFNTQLVVSAQLLHGFQANPYRAIWLGRAAVQEHHPDDRARYAATLSARLWLRPIGGALQALVRGYRDTWDVMAVSAELAYERGIGERFRFRLRGRYHTQGKAAFYSDDYGLMPRGQYFTGDRELSSMSTWLVGAQFTLAAAPNAEGKVLRVLESFHFVLKADYLRYNFEDFHYGMANIPVRSSIFGTLGLNSTF